MGVPGFDSLHIVLGGLRISILNPHSRRYDSIIYSTVPNGSINHFNHSYEYAGPLPILFQFEGVIGDGPCFVEINQPAGGIGRDYIGFFPSGKRFVGTFVTISFVA